MNGDSEINVGQYRISFFVRDSREFTLIERWIAERADARGHWRAVRNRKEEGRALALASDKIAKMNTAR